VSLPERGGTPAASPATAALSLSAITKRYGQFEALRGVDLEIAQGEFFGLLGPNGAGKTSLISIIAGLSRPSSGQARVMGHDVIADYRAARRSLGVVPQELVFDPFFTVRETLRITSGYYGLKRNDDWIDEILENLQLSMKAEVNMRALSGGMKRRVLVAQALVHRPPVIVLDEPTAGVDVELRQTLWKFIGRLNQAGHTIVLTTHYLEEAQALCGRIAMLKAGQVVALDHTSRLLGRLGGGRVRLKTVGAGCPPALQQAFAVEVRADGWIDARLSDWSTLEALLSGLREAGCQVQDIETEHTDLEDVFMRIMSEAA
jgi:ABC-2 type transport system ATP-binding protein